MTYILWGLLASAVFCVAWVCLVRKKPEPPDDDGTRGIGA